MTSRPTRVRGLALAVVTLGVCAVRAYPLSAQQPTPASPQPALAPYRPPVIALVQPSGGGSVPPDRPVVVFRFAQGEPADPVDVTTFAVSVDGADRTALFQVTAGEAWGPLAPTPNETLRALAPGPHQVAARVCSARGACGTAAASVTVLAGPAAVPATATPAPNASKKRRLIDALLAAGRTLLPH